MNANRPGLGHPALSIRLRKRKMERSKTGKPFAKRVVPLRRSCCLLSPLVVAEIPQNTVTQLGNLGHRRQNPGVSRMNPEPINCRIGHPTTCPVGLTFPYLDTSHPNASLSRGVTIVGTVEKLAALAMDGKIGIIGTREIPATPRTIESRDNLILNVLYAVATLRIVALLTTKRRITEQSCHPDQRSQSANAHIVNHEVAGLMIAPKKTQSLTPLQRATHMSLR